MLSTTNTIMVADTDTNVNRAVLRITYNKLSHCQYQTDKHCTFYKCRETNAIINITTKILDK